MEGDRYRFLPPDDDAPDDVQCPECGAVAAFNNDTGYHECIQHFCDWKEG